MCRVRVKLKDK